MFSIFKPLILKYALDLTGKAVAASMAILISKHYTDAGTAATIGQELNHIIVFAAGVAISFSKDAVKMPPKL